MMNNSAAESEFRGRVEKLEILLSDLQACSDPVVRGQALEAVQTLMEFHGAGISKLLEYIEKAGAAGKSIMASAANDDLVGSLLLLYGLHPADFESRVRQALDHVRPQIEKLGGSFELLEVSDGIVRLRAQTSGHGCQSTGKKIQTAIEEAIISKAPEATVIEIDGLAPAMPAAGFVPVEQLLGHHGRATSTTGESHEALRSA
jgi:Fe-S cluster biogenesis protein NfuA